MRKDTCSSSDEESTIKKQGLKHINELMNRDLNEIEVA